MTTVNYRQLFSLRQLQEKCREQRCPLSLAFIDLTGQCGCLLPTPTHPKLLTVAVSFQDGISGTIQYDGSSSDTLPIMSGVEQGCVLVPTHFSIFFSLVMRYAFLESERFSPHQQKWQSF